MDTMERTSSPPPAVRGRSPVVRTLWRLFGVLMVVVGLWWGTLQVVTLLAHEERVEIERFAAADVSSLDVRSSAGSVRVTASATDEVVVRAEISEGLRSTGESRTIVGGVLELRGTCPNFGSDWCRVTYDVEVPSDLPVVLDVDNGAVDVSGVDAAVEINADNGSVRLADVGGPIVASTDNGRVEGTSLRAQTVRAESDNGRVTLNFVAAPMTVEATTNNGSVEVVVPNTDETYRLSMDTANGREEESVRVDPASERSLILRSDNGSVTARTSG